MRRRTQAKQSSVAAGRHAPSLSAVGETATDGAEVVERMKVQAQAGLQPLRESPQPMPSSALPQPRPQQPRIPDAQMRYSLSDAPVGGLPASPPVSSPSVHGPAHGQGHGRAAGRPPGRRHGSSDRVNSTPATSAGTSPAPLKSGSPALPPPAGNGGAAVPATPRPAAAGAATFAEMGFQSGKAEDKDCIIM